ncbi:type VI secretion system baseplate subunit TssE [Chelatococcus sp. GCM10030263]|uniref:type VI secretion system baseplate subunit TssE n=1 Tax=Chelatococcus sp. GCM10030263 TaxID=3273387 RepID=UPI00361AB1BB
MTGDPDCAGFERPLVERLCGEEEQPAQGEARGFARMRDALRAELELILNTRRPCLALPQGAPELARSLIAFGLPDLAGEALVGETDAEHFRATVEEAIRLFAPSLGALKVELAGPTQSGGSLSLRISAMLVIGAARRPLAFESALVPGARRFHLTDGGDD